MSPFLILQIFLIIKFKNYLLLQYLFIKYLKYKIQK